MDSKEESKATGDLVPRGSFKPSPFGRAVFVGLRAIDPLIQYTILSRHAGISWIPQLLGGALLPATGAAYLFRPANTGLILDLPPYQSLLLCMSIGSMLKQSFWALAIGKEELLTSSAVIIATFATIMNGLNGALAMWTRTSVNPTASTVTELLKVPTIAAGASLFVTGVLVETVSEIQRSRFKQDPRNKGKPYAGGLFSLARNINYTGFTLWKTGYALVAAGPAYGLLVAAFHFYDFSQRAIPILDDYCAKRYGDGWQDVRKKVPKVLIPGIY